MVYRGHMHNGVAVLDLPADIPDGTPVEVKVEHPATGFWTNKSLEQLKHEQLVRPIQSAAELAGDWPAEDSIDEFLTLVRKVRS